MKRRMMSGLLCGLICAAALIQSAGADILVVSNLSETLRANTPIANPQYWAAQSFFAGTFTGQVTSIDVIAGNAVDAPAAVAELRKANIDGEIDTSAAGLLGTFSAPDLSGVEGIRIFLPDNLMTLLPATKYWFILGASNDGTFDWSYAETPYFTGLGSLGNYADSSDGGASWDHRDDAFPYFIRVNARTAPIPEPSVYLVIILGLTVGSLRRPTRT